MRALFCIASLNMAVAVAFGAFGSHALKASFSAQQLSYWQTATDYFFIHAIGLFLVAIVHHLNIIKSYIPFVAMQLGIVLFCGCLYAMAVGMPKQFGILTPIGGTLFLVAWLLLALHIYKQGTLHDNN